MANEAENAIYNRLANAPTYHPSSASLFAGDWGLEPGDVVGVKAGTTTYNVPVYSMNLNWKGNSKVEIQSTGNEKREPLPELKRRSYGSGAKSYRTQIANEEIFQSIISKTGINELGEEETLYSMIYQDATTIEAIVQNVGSNGTVTAASIALAITNAGSSVTISADHIALNGTTTLTDFFTNTGTAWEFYANRVAAGTLYSEGTLEIEFGGVKLGSYTAEWKDKEVIVDMNGSTPVKEHIYYLGRT